MGPDISPNYFQAPIFTIAVQSLAKLNSYQQAQKNSSYHLVILGGHLWGGRFQMSATGERQVTGENGGNPSGRKGYICSEYESFVAC
jgi:hypothetical protein